MITKEELLARWPTDIPFKGKLISDDGCMCAQGQVLHYIGGMTPDDLRAIGPAEADWRTAELLGISRAHAVLLRRVNDSAPGAPTCVITEPEKVLGSEAQRVLAFWRHLDCISAEDWAKVSAARAAAWADARAAAGHAAWYAANDAARDAVWEAAGDVAWAVAGAVAGADARAAAGHAAWYAANDAAWEVVAAAAWDAARGAAGATNEIQGAAIMRQRGQPFVFLPMFGFATPEEIAL